VSAKCTFQLSRSSTFASAAATPPSAMTVWALPSSDLQINPTFTPAAEASIAARRPAPPAPITRTSYFSKFMLLKQVLQSSAWFYWVLQGSSGNVGRGLKTAPTESENPEIGPDPHRAEPHVDIGECDREQAA